MLLSSDLTDPHINNMLGYTQASKLVLKYNFIPDSRQNWLQLNNYF